MLTSCKSKQRDLISRSFGTAPKNPFTYESTYKLMKKLFIYRLSQSDFLLNNGESLTNFSYKFLGKGITNTFIESTGGELFTAGPTLKTLTKDSDYFW